MSFDVIILTRKSNEDSIIPKVDDFLNAGYLISSGKWLNGSNINVKEFYDSLVSSHWKLMNGKKSG